MVPQRNLPIQKSKHMKHCPQCSTGYPDSHITCPTHGVLLNEIRDLKPGMVIHQSYRIVRKLGQGGMGAVYLAQHILMDEPRALKFLSPELSRDQAFTGRFLREVRVLRQIRNRNVVDCGDLEAAEDGSLFFSMEFVDGPDLRAFLHDAPQPFDVPLALSIARQIAEGLGAAHAKGMVHRDIKPENILMARDGDAWVSKIADFGIVATKESSTAYTRTGGTLLTMAYAAPEQWRGTPAAELDGRTDLYALGGVLFEMLTGGTVFQAENYEGWAAQHQRTTPIAPSRRRLDVANWWGLDELVLRLLSKKRDDRPKDVAEVLQALDAIQFVPDTRYPIGEDVEGATGTAIDVFNLQPDRLIRGKYRIVRKLGGDGYGARYLAEQSSNKEWRALSFVSPELCRSAEAPVGSWASEKAKLPQLRHKNVVHSSAPEWTEEGALFFPSEFVDGPDLRGFLDAEPRPISVSLALDLTRGIAEGLGAAHALGILHRDIKPENIRMARDGEKWVPKIAGFGILSAVMSSSLQKDGGTGILVTLAYAAPEQWCEIRQLDLDGRADLYALGGMLFEMLTGQTAFKAESFEGWWEQQQNVAADAPSSLRPELANWRGLDALVLRLLAKDRDERPRDAAELLRLLGAVQDAPQARRETVREVTMPDVPATPVRKATIQELL
jgi:serine/threonine protein kinase